MAAPLDPTAKPYHKIPPTPHFFFYFFPHPPPPVLPPPSPIFSTYNIRFQPSIRITFPLSPPPPLPEKNVKYSPTPVPPRRRRRISFRNSGKSNGDQMKWRLKTVESSIKDVAAVVEKDSPKTRWKNKRGVYENVLPLEANTTSVMIKNIPNKYTRELLIQTLDNHCALENKKLKEEIISSYDFLYLPIDFNRRLNAGFAFVNFTSADAAKRFRDAFHGKRWDFFGSPKVAEISRARIQGRLALINHCKGMDFTYGSEEDMPVWFEPARDGSGEVSSKMLTVGKYLPSMKIKYG